MGNLTTLDRALQWLQQTSDPQDLIARLIAATSQQIQNWLGYQILQASYTRTFNGQGGLRLFVPDLPLVSVASLIINGDAVPTGSTVGNAQQAGYYNDAHSIGLIGYRFWQGFQNITTTYTAGYQKVPFDLEQACLDWMKASWANQLVSGVGVNVTDVGAGDNKISFGGKGSVTDVKMIPMPASVFAVLQSYRRVVQVNGF